MIKNPIQTMIKNLIHAMIFILMFWLFLLLSVTARAQSHNVPNETRNVDDRRDIGHQPQPEHIEDYAKDKSGSASDSKKSSSSTHSSGSSEAKPNDPSSADQKNPSSGTGEPKLYK
jgi:hypothetical protein